jgi:hypothetical protein
MPAKTVTMPPTRFQLQLAGLYKEALVITKSNFLDP